MAAVKTALAIVTNAPEEPQNMGIIPLSLASEESDGLSGRLVSAVWDDWESMNGRIDQIMASDLYTVRRVVESK